MRANILLVLWMLVSALAMAQDAGWEQVGQEAWPYRPSVGEIVRTPAGALLACPFGDRLYRTTDEGASWAPVDIDETLPYCAIARGEGGTLFAGTGNGVYRSDDDGLTWTLSGLERVVFDLEWGPGGRLWAIAREGDLDRVLLRSEDGATWTLVADEEAMGADFVGPFQAVSFSPGGAVFIGARYGLFRSVDDAATWEEIDIIPSSGVVFASGVAYVGATDIFDNGNGYGPYRSTDGGLSWEATTAPNVYVEALAVTEDGALLAGTDDGLYESADGIVWEPAGLNGLRRVSAVLPREGESPAFLATERSIFRGEGADGWEPVDQGFERGLAVDALAVEGETLCALANGDLYRYDHGVGAWELLENAGLQTGGRAFFLVSYGDALLLGTGSGLFRSEDDGETWKALWLAEGEEERFSTLTVLSSGALVLGSVYSSSVVQIGQLFFSTDGGDTWTVSTGWDDGPAGIPSDITETPSGTLLVSAIAGKFNPPEVYRSSDGGASWMGQGGDGVWDLAVTPTGTIVGVGSGGHYRSVDDGLTWEQTDDTGGFALTAAPNGGLAAVRDPEFFYIRDVYYSVDEGLSWAQVSTDLRASTLATDAESYMYTGTGGQGVFRSATPLTVNHEGDPDVPRGEGLAASFPNPAVASVRIPFALSEAGSITLTVHDILGRRVATLAEDAFSAGRHTVTWNMAGVASGVYIVRLQAGGQTSTQRVTVVR